MLGTFSGRIHFMRHYIDCEFIEDGETIDLISIAVVAEDGREFYAINSEADLSKANAWVKENVLPLIPSADHTPHMTRKAIADALFQFAGFKPVFWGYCSAYDWVAICQIFGAKKDLPPGWPAYCRDVKQFSDYLGSPKMPAQENEHDALAEAKWVHRAHLYLMELDRLQRDFTSEIPTRRFEQR